jgi:hypothetical protein
MDRDRGIRIWYMQGIEGMIYIHDEEEWDQSRREHS